MIKNRLIHPQITAALARGGHGSRVLISDGNYPHATARGPNAEVVYLNLAPGLVGVCDVLRALTTAIPVERAAVLAVDRTGPYAMAEDPDVWGEYRALLAPTDCGGELVTLDRAAFYAAACGPEVCLTVATGERQVYANLLLTIGVVR